MRYDRESCDYAVRVADELIIGTVGSVLFVILLLYRLKNGRKAVRFGKGGIGNGQCAHRKNRRKLALLVFLVVVAAAAYLFTDVSFANERLFRYAMKIRIPKLIAMLVTAAAIGGPPLYSSL